VKPDINTELRHLRREIRTALELALVALAPTELLDRLALSAGFLEAFAELPADSPPLQAFVPTVLERARRSLHDYRTWEQEHRLRG
jgi:hypothetical protein